MPAQTDAAMESATKSHFATFVNIDYILFPVDHRVTTLCRHTLIPLNAPFFQIDIIFLDISN